MHKRRVDAVALLNTPVLLSQVNLIAALATRYRLPSAGFYGFAEAGGLLSYGENAHDKLAARGVFCAADPPKCATRGPTNRATEHVRVGNQYKDGRRDRRQDTAVGTRARGSAHRLMLTRAASTISSLETAT